MERKTGVSESPPTNYECPKRSKSSITDSKPLELVSETIGPATQNA
jgi:hypothetical protein